MATAADWATAMGRQWAGVVDGIERQLEPLADAGIAALAPGPGERVLDIGCGAGATTRLIARRVLPGGCATGIDISPDLVAIARRRGEGLPGHAILEGDAGAMRLDPAGFDALFSRVGCMFFDDPSAAFANLHGALRPDGRAVFVVFAEREANLWATVPMAAAEAVLGPAPAPSAPSPGPFSWEDPQVFAPLLRGAGFRGIDWDVHEMSLPVGDGSSANAVERAVSLVMRVGPVAGRLREAPPEAVAAVAERLRVALAAWTGPDAVRLPARVRVIRARA